MLVNAAIIFILFENIFTKWKIKWKKSWKRTRGNTALLITYLVINSYIYIIFI